MRFATLVRGGATPGCDARGRTFCVVCGVALHCGRCSCRLKSVRLACCACCVLGGGPSARLSRVGGSLPPRRARVRGLPYWTRAAQRRGRVGGLRRRILGRGRRSRIGSPTHGRAEQAQIYADNHKVLSWSERSLHACAQYIGHVLRHPHRWPSIIQNERQAQYACTAHNTRGYTGSKMHSTIKAEARLQEVVEKYAMHHERAHL